MDEETKSAEVTEAAPVVEAKPKPPAVIGLPPTVEEVLAHPEQYEQWRKKALAVLNG